MTQTTAFFPRHQRKCMYCPIKYLSLCLASLGFKAIFLWRF